MTARAGNDNSDGKNAGFLRCADHGEAVVRFDRNDDFVGVKNADLLAGKMTICWRSN
jgi:hypothetical protein